MPELQEILTSMKSRYLIDNVNVKNNNVINDNVKPINEQIEELLQELKIKPQGIAILLAEILDDEKSIPLFTIIIEDNPDKTVQILEAAYLAKEKGDSGKLRKSKGAYFIGILKHMGIRTRYKKK